jgi:hypothetical protein
MSEPFNDTAVYVIPICIAPNPISKVACVESYALHDIGGVPLSLLRGDVGLQMKRDLTLTTGRYYSSLFEQMHEHPYIGHVLWVAIRLGRVSRTAAPMLAELFQHRIVHVS